MKRTILKKGTSKKIYNKGKQVKSINERPRPMRGGIRL